MSDESSGMQALRKPDDSALVPFIIISLTLHLFLAGVVPLLTHLLNRKVVYERPQAFQLVAPPRLPTPPSPIVAPQPAAKATAQAPAKPKPAPKPAAQKTKDSKKAEPEKVEQREPPPPQENLDELSSLLNEIPPPAQVSAVGKFRFNAYLMYVQSKIESKWQPPSQKKDVTVTVAFTIFQNGTISEVVVSESAGSTVVDNLAMNAVNQAAPFSSLPPAFSADRQEFSVKLNTALR